MNKIESFLKFTLPTIVIASLSYEIFYLWGLDISIADSPISNGDILRGWQQWYLFLSPLIIITIYPDFLLTLWQKLDEKLTKSPNKDTLIPKLTIILQRIALGISYTLLLIYILFGDVFQAFFLLSLSAFFANLTIKLMKSKVIDGISFTLVTSILIISSIFGSVGSILGLSEKYNSLFSEDSYIEIDNYKKTVIRTYENWTLVRYGFESYAWIHHQSDRKIIHNTDRTHFLGVICYAKRNGYVNNFLGDSACDVYVKHKTIEDDEDEYCLLDALKRDESKQENLLKKCLKIELK